MPLQDQLREYFDLDSRVREMRRRLDAAIRRRDTQQRKLQQLQQQSVELREELKRLQAKATTFEREAQTAEQRVAELRDRMNAVTNNKEYSALLVEVNTQKVEKSKLEDQALEQMSQVEQAQARSAELDEKIDQQQKVVTSAEEEVVAARGAVGDRLDAATSERDAAAATIPADVLDTFNRLAENYDGEAMAQVEEQNRRRMEYICGGCFIQLPVENLNALMSRPDVLVTCPNCKRILYVHQDLKSALAPK